MKDRIKLLKLLYTRAITPEQFIRGYFENEEPSDDLLSALLYQSISEKESDKVEEVIALLNTERFVLSRHTLELCRLITYDWHFKHEDIATLLAKIQDPISIDYLFNAIQLKLEYLEYDDTFQFARKCIKAISSINSENAIEKLKLLSLNGNEIISGYAKKELRYKDDP